MRLSVAIPTERQVQRSILQMCGTCFRDVLIHHSPNGAHLAGSDEARFKQMGALIGDGMKRGWPDLQCLWAPGVTAFIETKRPKTGRLTPDQEAMHERLRSLGFHVATVTSQDEAYRFLKECGAPCSGQLMVAA